MARDIPQIELRPHPETGELVPEEWRDVYGYGGHYEVSNYGRVKSIARKVKDKNGIVTTRAEALVSHFITKPGYCRLNLWKHNTSKKYFIHVLVATAFHPNPDSKPQVNHKKGIKSDNFAPDLEWSTMSENLKHAYKTGLKKDWHGENGPSAKLTNIEAGIIRDALKAGYKHKDIANYFKVNRYTVTAINLNKSFKV